MKIGIISYGIGNVGSVVGCINNIGVEYQVIKEKNEFNGIDKLIYQEWVILKMQGDFR